MSLDVKLTFDPEPPVKVGYEALEKMTNLEPPWIQQSEDGGAARYYGLCPECENPMHLINPFGIGQQTPHGRHVLTHVAGFTHDLEAILNCSRFKGTSGSDGPADTGTAVITPQGRTLRDFVVENADFIIGILTEDIGVSPSRKLTRTLFATFFDNLFYLWPDTNPGNVPWLLFRTVRTYPLYDQIIRQNSETAKAILRNVDGARIGAWNRLETKPGGWIDVRFSLQQHRISGGLGNLPRETVQLVISSHEKDATVRNLLEKTIHLRPAEFLRRIRTRRPPTGPGQAIIAIAREELRRHIAQNPHLE